MGLATNLGNDDEFTRVERRLVEVTTQGHTIAHIVDKFGQSQTPVGVVDGHGVLVKLSMLVHY